MKAFIKLKKARLLQNSDVDVIPTLVSFIPSYFQLLDPSRRLIGYTRGGLHYMTPFPFFQHPDGIYVMIPILEQPYQNHISYLTVLSSSNAHTTQKLKAAAI